MLPLPQHLRLLVGTTGLCREPHQYHHPIIIAVEGTGLHPVLILKRYILQTIEEMVIALD